MKFAQDRGGSTQKRGRSYERGALSTPFALAQCMAALQLHRGAAALVCCFAYACSSNSGSQPGSSSSSSSTSNAGVSETGGNSAAVAVEHRTVDDSGSSDRAGAAAVEGRAVAEDGSAGAIAEGSAGEGTTSDSVPPSSVDQQHTQCDLHASCVSKGDDKPVTCGVEALGIACEFEGFAGATADVSSGKRAVVGTACCGGCGCVPVEVYFDGTHCWQGIPQCTLPQFTDQLFDPHGTSKPNTSFTPPSNFYLGSGGIGGSAPTAAGGSAGSTGGTAGMDIGGAPVASAGTGGASAGSSGSADNGGADSGGAAQATAGAPSTPEGGSTSGL